MIAEIDTTDVLDHIDDVQADVVQSGLDIKRRKAVYVAQMEAYRQPQVAAPQIGVPEQKPERAGIQES